MIAIKTVKQEFDSVKGLVCNILNRYPHTRSSDTELYLQCCRAMGANTLDEASRTKLSIISIHKVRQVIQNKEGRYLPSEKTVDNRESRNQKIREYMRV